MTAPQTGSTPQNRPDVPAATQPQVGGVPAGEPELSVDAAGVRQAADVLDRAATAFGFPTCEVHRSALAPGALGPSAAGEEVIAIVARRVPQAFDCALALGQRAMALGAALRRTADAFDAAESAVVVAPR